MYLLCTMTRVQRHTCWAVQHCRSTWQDAELLAMTCKATICCKVKQYLGMKVRLKCSNAGQERWLDLPADLRRVCLCPCVPQLQIPTASTLWQLDSSQIKDFELHTRRYQIACPYKDCGMLMNKGSIRQRCHFLILVRISRREVSCNTVARSVRWLAPQIGLLQQIRLFSHL